MGNETVPETYVNESDVAGAFTVHEGITNLTCKFAQGVAGFDRAEGFVNLDEKALAAAMVVEAEYMVSYGIDSKCHSYFG